MDGQPLGQTLGGDPDTVDSTCPSRVYELPEQRRIDALRVGLRQEARREQRIVELVGIARIGALFIADTGDGRGVEGAEVAGGGAARVDGLRAALLERSVVEELIRARVQDVVRKGRRLRGIAGHEL